MGSGVGGGLAGADDGGAAAVVVGPAGVPGADVGVGEVVAPAVELGLTVLGLALLAVGLGAAELVVGPGAGGPKQPVSTIRPLSPRTLSALSLGLAMMPP
ncbi:hypothetical protein [Arthrobacter sp. MAHUQ-56]